MTDGRLVRLPSPRTVQRLRSWWTEPFRTQVHVYDRTRVEFRAFPPRLRVQALPETAQAAMNRVAAAGGGAVPLPRGTIHLTEPLTVSGGSALRITAVRLHAHGASSAIQIDPSA